MKLVIDLQQFPFSDSWFVGRSNAVKFYWQLSYFTQALVHITE